MKVNCLPEDPGVSGWYGILPSFPARSSLQKDQHCDCLIVGAGFTGLNAARRLSELRQSERIVVLEANRVAEGPAGRNSGFMIDLPHVLSSKDYAGDAHNDAGEIRLNRAGIEYALAAAENFGMSAEAIARSGKINGAITSRGVKHNDDYAKHLQALSEPYERIDAAGMMRLTGSDSYIDGLYTPGTAMIQPALYIQHLAGGIETNGVKIYERSPVLSIKPSEGQWFAKTPAGSITAKQIILSVNGHLQSFGYYPQHLMHIFTYASMTRALSAAETKAMGGEARWGLTPADSLGTTVRRISGTGGDRLIIRNRATYEPSMIVDSSRLGKFAQSHDRSFRDRFPKLSKVNMEYCWGGKLCLSRNNVSVFGEIEENLYAACCQNGLGTAKGTIAGKLVAELASEQRSSLVDDLLCEAPPRRLPPSAIASVGAGVMLRFGEYRAGKEL
ncbi:MAG: FAD-binding oxidoreductase [Granulosicoccus sp.]|nr:FAD-binding oxidoreductase [Granulosicoccus sp.]